MHYRRHPWLLDVATSRTVFGPNVLARYDAALAAVDRTGLAPQAVVGVVSLLDGFVRGAARAVVDADRATASTGQSDAEWWASDSPRPRETPLE
jgi:hypothetical protein